MRFIALYIGTVVLVNVLFSIIPPISLPNGVVWPPASIIVGFIFVIRDYVQREVGHWVLPAMIVGAVISGLMVEKEIAFASICAFFFGEMVEWFIYTITKRPFSERMFWSCAISTPVDSLIFLAMLGFFSWEGILIMTTSKMAGVLAVFFLAKRRERQQELGATT